MARAKTKIELIEMANSQYSSLFKLINQMDENQQENDFCYDGKVLEQKYTGAHWQRDKNLRDVLIHLYEWHQLLIKWEKQNSNGQNKPFLPPPYTWKSYGEMNLCFHQKHQNTTLQQAKALLEESHKKVIDIIEKYSDEQLFTKQYFNWTGSSSLGQYCISVTASHYEWAIKKLKIQIKTFSSNL